MTSSRTWLMWCMGRPTTDDAHFKRLALAACLLPSRIFFEVLLGACDASRSDCFAMKLNFSGQQHWRLLRKVECDCRSKAVYQCCKCFRTLHWMLESPFELECQCLHELRGSSQTLQICNRCRPVRPGEVVPCSPSQTLNFGCWIEEPSFRNCVRSDAYSDGNARNRGLLPEGHLHLHPCRCYSFPMRFIDWK